MYTHLLTAHTGPHNHMQVAHALANENVFCLLNTSCRQRDTAPPNSKVAYETILGYLARTDQSESGRSQTLSSSGACPSTQNHPNVWITFT